jgi:hypothetical protein
MKYFRYRIFRSFEFLYFKEQNTIDLISGLARTEGKYYAISKDFNLKEAWNRFGSQILIMEV